MPRITIDGAAINYEEVGAGAGEPLLYLAYTRFDSAAHWVPYMQQYASGFRVLLPDPRGMAGSTHQREVRPEQWVSDLVSLLDALGLESVHMAAETLGCRVATRLAADHPERVRSLILNAPIAYSSPESDAVRRASADAASLPPARQETMRLAHGEDWPEVNQFYQGMHDREDFKRYFDLREVAPRVQARTLVMRGDIDEPVHPIEHATVLHSLLKHSWLAILPRTGFNALTNRPEEAWKLIAELTADG